MSAIVIQSHVRYLLTGWTINFCLKKISIFIHIDKIDKIRVSVQFNFQSLEMVGQVLSNLTLIICIQLPIFTVCV